MGTTAATAGSAEGSAVAAYNQITLVNSISGPNLSSSQIDVTPLEENQAKQFLADLAEPGTMDFDVYLDSADPTHQDLLAQLQNVNSGLRDFFVLEDGGVGSLVASAETLTNITGITPRVYFQGSVVGFNRNYQSGSAITASVSVQVSGAITETVA